MGFLTLFWAWVAVWIAGVVGWVWNAVKIIQTLDDPVTNLFIARVVGAFFAPAGAVLGYF